MWCVNRNFAVKPRMEMSGDSDALSRRAGRPRGATHALGTREQRKVLIAKVRKEIVTTKREIYRMYSIKTSLELTLSELLYMEQNDRFTIELDRDASN
jgi:hypothetical protein